MGAPGEADGYFAAEEAGSGASLEREAGRRGTRGQRSPVHRIDDLTLMYLTHEVYLDPLRFLSAEGPGRTFVRRLLERNLLGPFPAEFLGIRRRRLPGPQRSRAGIGAGEVRQREAYRRSAVAAAPGYRPGPAGAGVFADDVGCPLSVYARLARWHEMPLPLRARMAASRTWRSCATGALPESTSFLSSFQGSGAVIHAADKYSDTTWQRASWQMLMIVEDTSCESVQESIVRGELG
ncbi:Uncharacterised protein [Pseudomonas aeruginosa]|nr:Uncharacterised protein [Pseudomonas aeruginosa]